MYSCDLHRGREDYETRCLLHFDPPIPPVANYSNELLCMPGRRCHEFDGCNHSPGWLGRSTKHNKITLADAAGPSRSVISLNVDVIWVEVEVCEEVGRQFWSTG